MPYFHTGYFPSHDGEWAVVRAGEMFREIRDHQIPPRYSGVLNFGYGYPLFNFAYPFPYYLSTFLHFFKIGFVDSIKIIFLASVLFSYAGMFLLSSRYWKNNLAGFFSGILYVYLPYRLVDLFVRGSIGESISFAIYPFLLHFSLLILEKKSKSVSLIFTSILFSILIMTHNISAVYFGLIFLCLFFYSLFVQKNNSSWVLLAGFLWGTLMSSFFWLPALVEKKNILLSVIPIADRSLYYIPPIKLLYSPWGYETPTDKNPFTYQLGIVQIVGFLLTLITLMKKGKNSYYVFALLTVFLLCMTFSISFPVWNLPLLSEINYPWTLLLPIGFLMSFLSAGFIRKIKYATYIAVTCIILSIVLNIPYAKPAGFIDRPDNYYLTNEATTTSSQELMPLWVKDLPQSRFKDKIETSGKVTNLFYTSKLITFNLNLNKNELISVNQIYYPGWEVYVNSEKKQIIYKNKKGIMEVSLQKGLSQVSIMFKETKMRALSNSISIFANILLLGFMVKVIFQKKYGKAKKE